MTTTMPTDMMTTSLTTTAVAGTKAVIHVRYYEQNDTLFVDDRYVTRGQAGRILWLLLSMHDAEGRSSFSNRELRLHPFLKQAVYKDNLETRLLTLQRKLEELQSGVRIARPERGRLHLACAAPARLERIAA